MKSLQDSIAELQILIMDQQQAIETLSDQLIAQSTRTDLLQMQLSKLESRLSQIAEPSSDQQVSADQKPPHY